ncbi:MAG: bifunctional [glutamine synthetase] adenylyltransferase/[glutamine synthetase]-adenylyl-L-tyrosine phosphorylase [Beijerinckiaceae bacterium]|nr:bifunctional [glutamine synthetase] adenylyltransferase/[glutamine synthetase]-adenylyl-L-tyrosine phosphorylase [Beijerinckiaceae bacterium]MBX9757800.1 bifunctional [glutamine synthetase] adenylyltransferase/[glutamine synthetase]-adenylyl-L-tyrosine phosphorylase [Beijerinckiaceae bacterium]
MTQHATLADAIHAAPTLADAPTAEARLTELLADAPALADVLARPNVRALILGIANHSPYLWRLVTGDPDRLARLLAQAPDAALDACLSRAVAQSRESEDEQALMRALRLAKQEAALLIALADIGGLWDVVAVTSGLTRFADCMVSCALSHLLRQAALEGKLRLADPEDPERGCGVVVLALGKHGAGELNYSSDIDLVVFFDPDSPALTEASEPGPLFVRITKSLARILQERTGHGYVLRVDLRLRPDPGSTSVAISLPAAFSYYENLGQNWERAALIKARPVAGDKAIGAQFLADLAPFIWRKYFDYAAIADIHAMKRQIHAVRGHAEVAVAGHDVKLGRGGIREVEFFVQTQQLIFGGRRKQLRGARTLDMLRELAADGWVADEAVQDLTGAYGFLRTVEHRLQMLADEQTQRLPSSAEALAAFARFCGYPDLERFAAALIGYLTQVETHYARLFEHAPALDTTGGSLVFTGSTDDPETLETLSALGFAEPSRAAETIRGWHFGRRSGVQSARAREVLTELVPALLESFSGSGDPDAALAAFDAALGRMPAAVELFSILKSNAAVRDLFGDILGGAPRLANVIAQRPHVLDAAIDPSMLQTTSDEGHYDLRARRLLRDPARTEEFLDGARDMAQEESFLIGVRTLSGMIDPVDAGAPYAALAASLVRASLEQVRRNFIAEYGEVPGGRCAVIGMGKLGSREMTATSDLDLILLYDFDPDNPDSNGGKPLHAAQYYTRLTQRLVSALTVATRRGRLYDVDMRLRPSGGKGPLATNVDSFMDYQASDAEVWEHMTLTRARAIAGDASLCDELTTSIREVLAKKRAGAALRAAVHDMRMLIAKEKGDGDAWDLKLARGGMMDIEFIAQYLVLRHAAATPRIMHVETLEALKIAAEEGLVSAADGERLVSAHRLYTIVMQMIRLTTEGAFDPAQAASGVLRRIASAAGLPDFKLLENVLAETRGEVRAVFERLLGSKAG